MATEGDGGGVHSCQHDATTTGDDRISGLPNDLLHIILLRLGSTPEAARTSVLSRRWRRVWSAVPELSFRYVHDESTATPVCLRINQALAACSAPTVHRLHIAMPRTTSRCRFRLHHAAYANRWLRFASQRLSGELSLSMAGKWDEGEFEKPIVLPPLARATAIRFDLNGNTLRFEQTTGAGTFTALSTLRIENGHVDRRELQDVVSSRCPGLKELVLGYVYFLRGASGFCIRSDSLERLEVFGVADFHGGLEVDAPKLRFFSPRCCLPRDARIVAPMLSEVCWCGYPYNPMRHHLVDVGRHLRRLDVQINSPAAALMKLFDTIHDLNLTIDIEKRV
nr:unnamed protein product [Digitaria exilis]